MVVDNVCNIEVGIVDGIMGGIANLKAQGNVRAIPGFSLRIVPD